MIFDIFHHISVESLMMDDMVYIMSRKNDILVLLGAFDG